MTDFNQRFLWICRRENIVFQPLYGSPGQSSGELFADAVDKMTKKIHQPGENSKCTNEFHYDLYIYYSGHGGKSEVTHGLWTPTANTAIIKKDIDKGLKKLRKCVTEQCASANDCL